MLIYKNATQIEIRAAFTGGHTLSFRQIVLELLSGERDTAKLAYLEALLE